MSKERVEFRKLEFQATQLRVTDIADPRSDTDFVHSRVTRVGFRSNRATIPLPSQALFMLEAGTYERRIGQGIVA